jgi:hypothetical protein
MSIVEISTWMNRKIMGNQPQFRNNWIVSGPIIDANYLRVTLKTILDKYYLRMKQYAEYYLDFWKTFQLISTNENWLSAVCADNMCFVMFNHFNKVQWMTHLIQRKILL